MTKFGSDDEMFHRPSMSALMPLWHLSPQYRTDLQSLQSFNLMSSTSALPQDAQHDVFSSPAPVSALIVLGWNRRSVN